FRRGARARALRIHVAHTAPRHRALPTALATPRRPTLVALRHAPPAVGAAPGRQALLRPLRRNLAPLDPQSRRRQALARLGEADPPPPAPLPDAGAAAHAAN